ncbi:hypothetical protein AAG570_005475 [Ranatra chinensis]|uniref:Uncharacterized protein n=1 Tax=Ranatra chinensis TaxID=642074 RepID=A0ABD0XZ91_9HEMI
MHQRILHLMGRLLRAPHLYTIVPLGLSIVSSPVWGLYDRIKCFKLVLGFGTDLPLDYSSAHCNFGRLYVSWFVHYWPLLSSMFTTEGDQSWHSVQDVMNSFGSLTLFSDSRKELEALMATAGAAPIRQTNKKNRNIPRERKPTGHVGNTDNRYFPSLVSVRTY